MSPVGRQNVRLDDGAVLVKLKAALIPCLTQVQLLRAPLKLKLTETRKKKVTRLNQIVALEKGLKGRTTSAITVIHRLLQKGELFSGMVRVYTPKDEEGEQLPSEQVLVQSTVKTQLDAAAEQLTNLFDVVATKETGNTVAKADVDVDGSALILNASVPLLLFLEKELVNWRTLVSKLPLLDPATIWTYDEANGHYRTDPTDTIRSKKVMRALTLAPATERHPAQVQTYNEDVPAGTWTTTKFSGGVTTSYRDELVARADKLIDAVKAAREEANSVEVTQQKIAKPVFDYLLG